MNLNLFRKTILNGLRYFLFFVLLFALGRLVFLISYGTSEVFEHEKGKIAEAFMVGTRFDVSAICYGFLPLVLFWLSSLFIPKKYELGFSKVYATFARYYLLFVTVVFLTLIIIDYFFYQFFQSHINLLFFGIFNDDTTAVLTSVWTDYPLFYIALVYAVAVIAWLYWSKYVKYKVVKPAQSRAKIYGVIGLLIFPLFFIGMRGSVGVFTLRREHTNISKNEFVNSLCYNALYSLKFANSERKDNAINPDIERELQANGFASVEEVQRSYIGESEQPLFNQELFTKTKHKEFLAQNPPNVVFLQMESMSNHYFDLNNETLNLLGDLSKELPNLYYFKNSLSAYNGTIQTLEDFILGTPKTIISQSVYFDTPFTSSIALPFKQSGYETYFLTGASISWRNIDNMIKNQKFDVIQGKNFIQEKFPDAEEFAWGVHDGYLFDYIQATLKESKTPKFIFGLTISNHTPFEVPAYYHKQKITMSEEMKKKIRVDEETAYANFYSHQYAASELARFIKEIRNSPLGENTIIVASGDHNIRQVFEYTPEEGFLKRSVPILMYIPEKYKPAFFDANVVASHKDIFPTIFNLALSDASYFYTGDNLFDPTVEHRFALNDYNFIADDKGAVAIENNQPYYYTWVDQGRRKLKVGDNSSSHALYLQHKMQAYTVMKTVEIYKSINQHQKSN
ncbi:LTA synthase family protein [Myroides odoratus]|uniref:Lipoteichoic acid synthase 1 n=1 Tax=Myroides odoratus TaxID=256 RepID=A0A378RPY8_MYROD|nr:LTA synthase family protein [Myroides odoratus]QQU04350.1 LTA synthase family protein [Myroides odoratus]STZ28227.1 Lipoteichoic acid synthase 1 [Myroides odoratus]